MHAEPLTIVSAVSSLLAPESALARFLRAWGDVLFSLFAASAISVLSVAAARRLRRVPGRTQVLLELIVQGIERFIRGVLGPRGRGFVPFLGTLFVYILVSNLMGLVPLLKSPTSSLSMTLALALIVFAGVLAVGVREHGIRGYLDHLAGKPRGVIALSVVIPAIMLFVHVVTECVRPLTLSMRLRNNIWGDEVLLGVLDSFGLAGVPLVLFSMLLAVLNAFVQAMVFCLLSTIYFALLLDHGDAGHNSGVSETKGA